MALSTKPEVVTDIQCCQSKTATGNIAENLMESRRLLPEIFMLADRWTEMLITIFCCPLGRGRGQSNNRSYKSSHGAGQVLFSLID